MNHQIYLDWLFEDAQDLSAQQTLSLREHLEVCEQCRALSESFQSLESVLSTAEAAAPEAGFAHRWQTRLESSQQHLYRRQIMTALGLVAAGLVLLIGLMLIVLWPWLRSPSLLFYTWAYQLFSIYTYADALRDFASPLLNAPSSAIPLIGLVFSIGFLCELAVLWVVSFRLLTNPRRITL